MCKMKKVKTGSFSRDGMFVEVLGRTDDSQDKVIMRSLELFDLSPIVGKMICLFTMSGAMIPRSEDWTLGEHLQRTKK